MKYEIETKLRPAVEAYSAITAYSAAVIMWVSPEMLFLPEPVAKGGALILTAIAMLDTWSAYTTLRYRAGIRGTKAFSVDASKIPQFKGRLYLGRGFLWTQKHTQRLADTLDPKYAAFVKAADNYDPFEGVRDAIIRVLPFMSPLLMSNSRFNPLSPASPVGGNPAVHGVGDVDRNIFIPNDARQGNTLILGTTGVGKTRWMEIFLSQDIPRKTNDVVIVIDPKGDSELLNRMYIEAKKAGREDDFVVFHLGHPEHSARYNSIGHFNRITQVATRLANQLPSSGNAAAFKEFAWRFVNISAKALILLGDRPGYREIKRAIDDIEPLFVRYMNAYMEGERAELWKSRIEQIRETTSENDKPRNFDGRTLEGYVYFRLVQEHSQDIKDDLVKDLAACIKYDKTYYDKVVSNIIPLLEKLTSGMAGELLAPDYHDMNDDRPIFDWQSVIRKGQIVYVGLDALSDSTVSSAVGASMLSDLTSIAGQINREGAYGGVASDLKNPTIYLHLDEVNELIGDEFVPLVNKCRGSGMIVNAYTQAWHDIESRVGSAAKAEQITANFNNLFMMRVRNLATAELMASQLPLVKVNNLMAVTGARDGDYTSDKHFDSNNEDRMTSETAPLLHPSIFMQLPKGQAFALMEGGRLYKLKLPLPVVTEIETSMPSGIKAIVESMRKKPTGANEMGNEEQWWSDAGQGD